MHNNHLFSSVLFVLYVTKQLNNFVCLLFLRMSVFIPRLTVLRSASMVLIKFCPLCYKREISMSPRRIKVREAKNPGSLR